MSAHPDTAFKIVDRAEWEAAVPTGTYRGSAVDLTDGYIHLSTAAQLAETVRRHYAGRTDLMVLTVDLTSLETTWEPSRGGDLFPHLYAPLPVAAVVESRSAFVTAEGVMIFDEADA